MNKNFLSAILFLFSLSLFSQYAVVEKFELPNEVKESSGLIFFNNRLITHNDSDNNPFLYELDTLTGEVLRTVEIQNATNVDWEDITQDEDYIYIADIGNNSGDRTDLRIYRISKYDYENNNNVTADTINYSYANQTNFTSNYNATNWDAEAIISWGNQLLIFTKNWANQEVNIYSVPKIPGTYSSVLKSNYNVSGLITGAEQLGDSLIVLTGYDTSFITFVLSIENISLSGNLDLFSNSTLNRYTNIIDTGNQIEAICYVSSNNSKTHFFISNERFTYSSYTWEAKLRSFNLNKTHLKVNNFENTSVKIYPNPSNGIIYTEITNDTFPYNEIRVINASGKTVLDYYESKNTFLIDLSSYSAGIYLIIIKNNQGTIKQKVIIH